MEIRVFEDRERKEILSKAIAKYGENQLDIAQEELSELIQAISKIKRYPNSKDAQLNLIEEIADVSIMIEQLQMYFGITDEVVQDEADIKLDRLENRMFEKDAIEFYRDYLDKQKTKQFDVEMSDMKEMINKDSFLMQTMENLKKDINKKANKCIDVNETMESLRDLINKRM